MQRNDLHIIPYQVLNLFLALMLNSFATDSISKNKEELQDSSKMKQGWKKLKGLFKSNRPTVNPSEGQGSAAPEKKKPSIADIIEELKRQKEEQKRREEAGGNVDFSTSQIVRVKGHETI